MRNSFIRDFSIHAVCKLRNRLSSKNSKFLPEWLMNNLLIVIHPEDDHPGPHFTVLDLFIFLWLIAMLFKDSKFAYNYGLSKYIRREANVLSAFLQISFFIAYAFKSFAWVKEWFLCWFGLSVVSIEPCIVWSGFDAAGQMAC